MAMAVGAHTSIFVVAYYLNLLIIDQNQQNKESKQAWTSIITASQNLLHRQQKRQPKNQTQHKIINQNVFR